jgi:hypothetical protein
MILGAVGLLLVLVIVSVLAKKQLLQGSGQSPQKQSETVQQEVRQKLDAALQQQQQQRPPADDK